MLASFLALATLETTAESIGEATLNFTTESELKDYLEKSCEELTREQDATNSIWLLAYSHFKVGWGIYRDGKLEVDFGYDPKQLVELRLFGFGGELYLWKIANSGQFACRWRKDKLEFDATTFRKNKEKDGYNQPTKLLPNVAQEWQILWGTKPGNIKRDKWTHLTEDRGNELLIPHELRNFAKDLPLRLLVRHYLAYDKQSGLCYYQDMRLVELRTANLTKLS